jgi:hypothetical protein
MMRCFLLDLDDSPSLALLGCKASWMILLKASTTDGEEELADLAALEGVELFGIARIEKAV